MNTFTRGFRSFLAVIALLVPASVAHAQLPMPRLNSIYPCGARQGTSVECTIAGGDLEGVTGLYFSHPGIRAGAAGSNKFKVTVGNDVPPGKYDVRVIGKPGLSNFRAFVVSDWPEVLEKEPNDDLKTSQRVALPVIVNGRADKQTDVDHYVFTAKKGSASLSIAGRGGSTVNSTRPCEFLTRPARNSPTTAITTARTR
jgi:hypothetical protein